MALPIPHRLFTIEEFEHLCRTGFFREDERIELIDGEIVEMPPPNWPHTRSINALTRLLVVALLDESVVVSVQNTVRLPRSLVLPDLSVYRDKQYERTPGPEDVLLVIEVADSTITADRRYKIPRYAAAGIPEAWLMDINGETVERYTAPRNGRYHTLAVAQRGQSLASVVFPSLVIPVDAALGVPDDADNDADHGTDDGGTDVLPE